jgi:hypothetical protein
VNFIYFKIDENNRGVIIDKIFPQIYHVYNLQISCVDKVRKDKKKNNKKQQQNNTLYFKSKL